MGVRMSKNVIVAVLICAAPMQAWAAEDEAGPTVDISTNLLAPLAGAIALGIDVSPTKHISIEALVGTGTGQTPGTGGAWSYDWVPANLIGKYYLFPTKGGDGFFVQAFLRYGRRSFNWVGDDQGFDPDHAAFRVGGGAGLGFKHVFDFGLVLEAHLGLGYEAFRDTQFDTPGSSAQVSLAEWDPLLQLGTLGVGYRF